MTQGGICVTGWHYHAIPWTSWSLALSLLLHPATAAVRVAFQLGSCRPQFRLQPEADLPPTQKLAPGRSGPPLLVTLLVEPPEPEATAALSFKLNLKAAG